MERIVERELLDDLPPDHPGALRERRDLVRINACMGNGRTMARAVREAALPGAEWRIVELGAGDGQFLLRVARQLRRPAALVRVTLVDQQALLKPRTQEQFARLGWQVEAVQSDVFEWLRWASDPADMILANLFLHHFKEDRLRELFTRAAALAGVFIAVEPRRRLAAWHLCRWLWLIGCASITCHDATVSVRAGFAGRELSALWPAPQDWVLRESPATICSHLFVARRERRSGIRTEENASRRFPEGKPLTPGDGGGRWLSCLCPGPLQSSEAVLPA